MCQIVHEKLNNNSFLIYIVLKNFQRSSTCITLSLILTMAPEMKVQYFTEEEMEAQRGPQSDSRNRGRAPWLPGLPHV